MRDKNKVHQFFTLNRIIVRAVLSHRKWTKKMESSTVTQSIGGVDHDTLVWTRSQYVDRVWGVKPGPHQQQCRCNIVKC